MGLALRAVGQGFKVFVIQFLKGGAYTGEFIAGKNFLPNITLVQYGKICIKEQKQTKLTGFDEDYKFYDFIRDDIECGECRYCFLNDEQQKKYVEAAFERAKKVSSSGEYDLVILDEINIAIKLDLIGVDKVLEMIKDKFPSTELVLTGRGMNEKINAVADYVSEVKSIKHPFERGISARRGIEY
jgi:cob(I)alamin adenosyltransferase